MTTTVPFPENRRRGLERYLFEVVKETTLLGFEKEAAGWNGGAVVFLAADRTSGKAGFGPVVLGNTTNFSREDKVMLSAMCWSVVELLQKSNEEHVRKTTYPKGKTLVAEGVAVNGVAYVFAGFPRDLNLAAALVVAVLDNDRDDANFWSTLRFAGHSGNQLFHDLWPRVATTGGIYAVVQ